MVGSIYEEDNRSYCVMSENGEELELREIMNYNHFTPVTFIVFKSYLTHMTLNTKLRVPKEVIDSYATRKW